MRRRMLGRNGSTYDWDECGSSDLRNTLSESLKALVRWYAHQGESKTRHSHIQIRVTKNLYERANESSLRNGERLRLTFA